MSLDKYSDCEILKEFDRRFKNTTLLDWKYSDILRIIGPKFIRRFLKEISKVRKEFV